MHWFVRKFFAIAAVAPLTLGSASLPASAHTLPEADDWAKACATDTIEAYADFLFRYPDSSLVNEAYGRLSGMDVSEVGEIETTNQDIGQGGEAAPEFVPDSIMIV